MPLLCTSLLALLALLLLPPALSCDSQRPPKEVSDDYMAILQTHLTNTTEYITSLQQNLTCLELKNKPQSCISQNEDVVSVLHTLNCEMIKVRLPEAKRLTQLVQRSIRCSCKKTTEPPVGALKRKRKATRQTSEDKKKNKREKKLCKAMEILSNMTECYQMLNALLAS